MREEMKEKKITIEKKKKNRSKKLTNHQFSEHSVEFR